MGIIRPAILDLPDSPILDIWRMGRGLDGVIGLWAGEPDLPTPAFIADAAVAALREGRTFYTDNRGIPALRRALAAYLHRLYGVEVADERMAITSSGMNAVMMLAQGLTGPGDEAVVLSPSWPNVVRALQIAGATVREVALDATPEGWSLDLDRLFAACTPRTRVLYYASPGNPTGWMLEPEQRDRLLAFARERNIALLADEVYHRLVYDRPVAPSLLEVATPEDPVVVVNSFSKAWAMTGWRLGWVTYPAGLAPQFEKLVQFNTSGGQDFLQAGAIAALEHGEAFVASFLERCRAGRAVAEGRLRAMPGVHLVPNHASFYSMFRIEGVSDTVAFCRRALTEQRLGLAPGEAFGLGAEGHLRLCYAKAPAVLEEAMDRLERLLPGR